MISHAEYWLTNTPTIDEVRQLNRESLYLWPLELLMTLIDAGLRPEENGDVVLRQFPVITDDLVDVQIWAIRNNKCLAKIGIGCDRDDGTTAYFVVAKRPVR